MDKLEKVITGRGETKGRVFTQVKESSNGYIYMEASGYYEIFKKKIVHKFDWETRKTLEDTKEAYPNSAAFGVWAWTHRCLGGAIYKLDSL